MAFISDDKFAAIATVQKEVDEVLQWKVFPVGITYIINFIEIKQSAKYGECYILNVEGKEGKKLRVWGTTRMFGKVRERRGASDLVFFKSLGQRFENRKTYNEFDLVIDAGDVSYDIFKNDDENEIASRTSFYVKTRGACVR